MFLSYGKRSASHTVTNEDFVTRLAFCLLVHNFLLVSLGIIIKIILNNMLKNELLNNKPGGLYG